jgi:hypothetical protein
MQSMRKVHMLLQATLNKALSCDAQYLSNILLASDTKIRILIHLERHAAYYLGYGLEALL